MPDAEWAHWRTIAYGFARHWGCDAFEAEDVAQQAILAALTKGNDASLTPGWFFVVTRRLAPRLRHHEDHFHGSQAEASAAVAPSHDRFVLLSEIAHLQALNGRDRTLLAKLLEGEAQADIGRAFGWGTASVGVRVSRLIHKIQRYVSPPLATDGIDASMMFFRKVLPAASERPTAFQ